MVQSNDADFLDAIECGDFHGAQRYSGNGEDREVNRPERDGKTPLMLAAYSGHENIVRWLLGLGAHVTPQDTTGKTASDYAKEHGHTTCLRLLKNANARQECARTEKGEYVYTHEHGEGCVPPKNCK